MKFYLVTSDASHATIGCETSLKKAKDVGRQYGGPFHVDLVECEVSSETIRKLMYGGGYATDITFDVYVSRGAGEPS